MVTLDTSSLQDSNAQPPPGEIVVCPFKAIVDTREQHPWTFQGIQRGNDQYIVPREIATLATGDYSIEGFESQYTIERKSSDDLVGSVTAGHQRFEREHERMLAMIEAGGQACVICEGSLASICDELTADGRWKARQTLVGCTASWPFKYRVPWFFAGSRFRAEDLAFSILMKWWDRKEQM